MNRLEALQEAKKIVDEWADKIPTKTNGYTADGWKPPTLEQRADEILRIAEFLYDPQQDEEKIQAMLTKYWKDQKRA